MSSNRNYTGCTEISGEPDDNTKNIVFRIEQSRWKAGHPEYVRIRAQLSGNKRYTDWSEILAIKADKEMAANYKAYIDSLANMTYFDWIIQWSCNRTYFDWIIQ